MIIDLDRFVAQERPNWAELESMLALMESSPSGGMNLTSAQRLHYLYERVSAALAKINTCSFDPKMRQYLESLAGRAYAMIHTPQKTRRFSPVRWFFNTLPQTFRKHIRAFALSLAITVAGVIFGAGATAYDADAKIVFLGDSFPAHMNKPSERVKKEQEQGGQRMGDGKTAFASQLMANNIRVSCTALALGLTYGIGTIIVLFYNGVILGCVCLDYIRDGQGQFLAGWLLPHGSIEIPAILIAGQAGLVLASALLGRGDRNPLKVRMRQVLPSLVTLICGVAVMLVWAGIVEAFFSQYHEPVLPYWLKITFGCLELVLLAIFLGLAGRTKQDRTMLGVKKIVS